MALAHPAGDELRLLRAEVDDEDGVEGLVHGHQATLSKVIGRSTSLRAR